MYAARTTAWIIASSLNLGLFGCSGVELDSEAQTEPPIHTEHTENLIAANTEPDTEKKRHGKARFFERFDANGNGTLEISELPEHKREHFSRLDSDKNGALSKDELARGRKERGQHHFDPQRLDANNDGTIELAEVSERMKQKLAGADTNADGILSTDELKAHRAAFMTKKLTSKDTNNDGALTLSEVGDERWTRLSKADADQDGKVTFAEIDQARETGMLKRRGH